MNACMNGCVNDGVCDVHDGVCLGDVMCDGVFDVVCDGEGIGKVE